jgi:hypothetical protein
MHHPLTLDPYLFSCHEEMLVRSTRFNSYSPQWLYCINRIPQTITQHAPIVTDSENFLSTIPSIETKPAIIFKFFKMHV